MREAFGQALVALGKENPRLVVLDADVSKSTRTTLFGEAFPRRFFNCGVAEQNMVGVAAGLATMGFIPVVSTFAFLISLRAGEQVRTSIAYPKLNVKLVGGYCGLSDSKDGPTHQAVMDVAVMRAMPNVRVVCASDSPEAEAALRAIVADEGPWYLRISRAEVPDIPQREPFALGRGRTVVDDGSDCAIIASGTILSNALEAQQLLRKKGIGATVAEIHTLKPIDEVFLLNLARKVRAVVTVEEHSVIGGLASAVGEVLSAHPGPPVAHVGLKDTFAESGSIPELHVKYGLDAGAIARAAEDCLKRAK